MATAKKAADDDKPILIVPKKPMGAAAFANLVTYVKHVEAVSGVKIEVRRPLV